MRSACSLRRGNRSVYIRAVERAHGLRCTCEGGADVCAHARVELIAIPLNRVGMFSKRVHTRTRVEGARRCPLHGLLGKRFRRKPFVQVETFQRAADVARHGLRTVSTHRTHSAENIRQPSQSTVRTRPSKHSLHAHAHTHALTCAATCEDSSLHFRPAHSLRSPRAAWEAYLHAEHVLVAAHHISAVVAAEVFSPWVAHFCSHTHHVAALGGFLVTGGGGWGQARAEGGKRADGAPESVSRLHER